MPPCCGSTGVFLRGRRQGERVAFRRKAARPDAPWTSKLWVTHFRDRKHFTLPEQLQARHLDDFVIAYQAPNRHEVRDERSECFTYDELLARDKVNLDITWLRDTDDGATIFSPRKSSLRKSLRTYRPPSTSLRPWLRHSNCGKRRARRSFLSGQPRVCPGAQSGPSWLIRVAKRANPALRF